jgi:hypothetical protein
MNTIDRRDLFRWVQAAVHGAKRDDLQVEVIYLIKFTQGDEEKALHVPVDPHSDLPRFRIRQLVDEVSKKLPAAPVPSIELDSNLAPAVSEEISTPAYVGTFPPNPRPGV